MQHLNNNDSAIFKHLNETNIEPIFKQCTDYIDYIEASIQEGKILEEYKENGWKILNRTITGGLGTPDREFVRKWTKKKCIDIARDCISYKEFCEKYSGAKNYAEKHGFIKEIKSILKSPQICKWSIEKCVEKIKEFNCIRDYRYTYPGAYAYLIKHDKLKLLREAYGLKQRDKWTKEEAHAEALKYNTRKEFNNKANGCYQVAYKNGWINEICSHMVDLKKKRVIYNNENVIEEVKKHSKMEELKKSDNKFTRGCYWWMKKNKLLITYKIYLHNEKI